MISLLRRIRKKLLVENQLSSYLLYAIGEILLVAVGILLAFQVNSWNEQRKEKLEELKTYRELKAELVTTLEDLHLEEEELNQSLYMVYDAIKNKKPLTDQLQNAFTNYMLFHPIYIRDNTYQSLKLRGMDIISNDAIKTLLVALYETKIKWYTDGHLPISNKLVDQAMDYYMQHFETNLGNPGGIHSRAIPNDYAALQNDQQFLNLLSIMISSRKGLAGGKKEISDLIYALIKEVDQELERY